VKPIKEGGRVVGARISTVMYKEYSRGPEEGHVHIGSMKLTGDAAPLAATASARAENADPIRKLAAGQTPGYARWSSGPIAAKLRQPTEVSFDVRYGEGNDLKPGEQVDVYSTWDQGRTTRHVWGMHDGPVRQGDKSFVVTLPGDPSAATPAGQVAKTTATQEAAAATPPPATPPAQAQAPAATPSRLPQWVRKGLNAIGAGGH
jgi:hypothetical protein